MLRAKANNLILTGGHAATTAVAVVEEIKSQGKDWKLYWIGVRNAIEGKKVVTLESEVLPHLGVKFLPLVIGRVQRKFTFWTIPSILRFPIGFIQSAYYLLRIRPKAVLAFGGFASFPVVFIAKFLRIPVILHEQTSVAGRANLLSAKFASKIELSRKESMNFFPSSKCEIIGNPMMREIVKVKPKLKLSNPPVVFITGGSRGSQNINLVIEKIVRKLLAKYRIIHQTGGLDYLKFSNVKQKLPQALRDNYEVFIRVNPLKISKIYSKTDIVVGRAGANTVSEIMTIKRPAIFVPLPISYMDEQTKNAEIARNWGIAKIILQNELSPEKLLSEIADLVTHFTQIVKKVKSKKSPDVGASKKLVFLLSAYMK